MRVHLSHLTQDAMNGVDVARQLVEPLEAFPLGLRPEKWGHTEPFQEPFDLAHVEEMWAEWLFFWEGRRSNGLFHRKLRPEQLSGLDIEASTFDSADVETLVAYLTHAVATVGAVFAFVHTVTPLDQERGPYNSTLDEDTLSLGAQTLTRWLPDLYWITVLGPAYVELFGREKVLTVPVSDVKEIAADTFLLRLTDDIEDLVRDPIAFEELRGRVKTHLGENAFFDFSRDIFRVSAKLSLVAPDLDSADETEFAEDESVEAEMRHMAEVFLKVAREEGYDLDYSARSIGQLDQLIDRLFSDPSMPSGQVHEQFWQQMTPVIGAYLGCLIERNIGGQWALNQANEPVVVIGDSFVVDPYAKVLKRFMYGHDDQLAFFYKMVGELAPA